MSLLDTLDGSFMNFAYGWAFSQPVRKVYYNIVITGLSVAVALIIGTIELLGLLADQFGWTGGFWDWIGGIDLNTIGFPHRRSVRPHLGGGPAGLEIRPHRRQSGTPASPPTGRWRITGIHTAQTAVRLPKNLQSHWGWVSPWALAAKRNRHA